MPEALATSNRRAAYRVRPSSVHELDLSVLGERHQLIRGEVADIAVGGARVRFARGDAPKLRRGDYVVVALASKEYECDAKVLARVVSTTDDESVRTVQVAFDDDYEPLNIKRDELFAFFNRRALQRGPARAADGDYEVIVATPDSEPAQGYPASIVNISNAGMSVSMDRNSAAALNSHQQLAITLRRATDGRAHSIACTVRHRQSAGAGIVYGCEYDWSATTDPLTAVEEMVTFLLGRMDDG